MADSTQFTIQRSTPVPQEYADPFAERLATLRREQEALLNTPPKMQMYDPQVQQQRASEVKRAQVLGQLGGISNDKSVMNISEPLLKRAMEASKPKYSEHGAFDERSGQFHFFPGYQEARKLEAKAKELQSTEQAANLARAAWDRDRAQARELEKMKLLLQSAKGPEDRGSFSFTGTDPDTGAPIYLHSKLGPHVQDQTTGKLVPYVAKRVGPRQPELTSHQQDLYHMNRASLANVNTAMRQVEDNPEAVGAIGYLPNVVSQYVPGEAGAGGVGVRATVANLGSLKIHDRSGAAVTISEMPRLRPFIPNVTLDSPETIKKKLESFKFEYESILKEIEAGQPLSLIVAKSKANRESTGTIGGQPVVKPDAATDRRRELNRKYGIPD